MVPRNPNTPPPGRVSLVSTRIASSGPLARIGPVASPLSGSAGANLEISASASGRATTSRSTVGSPVVCTAARPTAWVRFGPS
jgi:hypothetical protein